MNAGLLIKELILAKTRWGAFHGFEQKRTYQLTNLETGLHLSLQFLGDSFCIPPGWKGMWNLRKIYCLFLRTITSVAGASLREFHEPIIKARSWTCNFLAYLDWSTSGRGIYSQCVQYSAASTRKVNITPHIRETNSFSADRAKKGDRAFRVIYEIISAYLFARLGIMRRLYIYVHFTETILAIIELSKGLHNLRIPILHFGEDPWHTNICICDNLWSLVVKEGNSERSKASENAVLVEKQRLTPPQRAHARPSLRERGQMAEF
jgi:hypothetical protein